MASAFNAQSDLEKLAEASIKELMPYMDALITVHNDNLLKIKTSTKLMRSSTQGRGQYSMEPHSYVEIPKSIADKIIAERGRSEG